MKFNTPTEINGNTYELTRKRSGVCELWLDGVLIYRTIWMSLKVWGLVKELDNALRGHRQIRASDKDPKVVNLKQAYADLESFNPLKGNGPEPYANPKAIIHDPKRIKSTQGCRSKIALTKKPFQTAPIATLKTKAEAKEIHINSCPIRRRLRDAKAAYKLDSTTANRDALVCAGEAVKHLSTSYGAAIKAEKQKESAYHNGYRLRDT